jgi:hypothetical protein
MKIGGGTRVLLALLFVEKKSRRLPKHVFEAAVRRLERHVGQPAVEGVSFISDSKRSGRGAR